MCIHNTLSCVYCQLVVTGYTDKLGVLLETIMKTLTTFKPDESRVAVFREQVTSHILVKHSGDNIIL